MILLVSSSVKSSQCASAIAETTGVPTKISSSFHAAAEQLRNHDHQLVVIDLGLAEADPEAGEALIQELSTAMPLYVNFAISGLDRVVREVRAGLLRHKREVVSARRSAEENLRNELKGTVTALLLSCEMALQVPGLPQAAEVKMLAVDELAREVKLKIEA